MTDSKVKCYRYQIEGYNDWVHKMDYFKGYKVFIPTPYNFSVFTLDDKIRYIIQQDKIDDFSNDYFGFNSKINEIELDKQYIEKLQDILIKEEEIKKDKESLVGELNKLKTADEIQQEEKRKKYMESED